MKNKKGFTLIELLAVIVILAVIALIATPLIMNTINDARDSAMQRSVQNIQHSAETHLLSKKVLDQNYTFSMDDFDYKGEKYDKMKISFNDKDESNVAVYKGKCFYVLAGSNNVIIDDILDETECLQKARKPLVMNEYGFYYDAKYSHTEDMGGGMIITMELTFFEDKSVIIDMFGEQPAGTYTYEVNKILKNGEVSGTFSNNGKLLEKTNGDKYLIMNTPKSELNEYGFYFNEKYLIDMSEAPDMEGSGANAYDIYREDGSTLQLMRMMGEFTYADEKVKVTMGVSSMGESVISEDGKSLSQGDMAFVLVEE